MAVVRTAVHLCWPTNDVIGTGLCIVVPRSLQRLQSLIPTSSTRKTWVGRLTHTKTVPRIYGPPVCILVNRSSIRNHLSRERQMKNLTLLDLNRCGTLLFCTVGSLVQCFDSILQQLCRTANTSSGFAPRVPCPGCHLRRTCGFSDFATGHTIRQENEVRHCCPGAALGRGPRIA